MIYNKSLDTGQEEQCYAYSYEWTFDNPSNYRPISGASCCQNFRDQLFVDLNHLLILNIILIGHIAKSKSTE